MRKDVDSADDIDEIKVRLAKVERQARNSKGWLIILSICVVISLFGKAAWRLWQINAACDTIVAENPTLEHSDCMRRVHEAWMNNQNTVRLD